MPSAVKVLFTNLRPTSQPGGSQLGKGPAASVHTSAQSMPGAIAVPVAPPSSSLGTQLSTPSMGSAVNSMSASRSVDHTSSVASQASNALLLSSNTYLLGGTAAGAGVTSPMATNAIAAESKEDLKIMRSVSAPEVVQSDNQPLLLSQGNFSHSMQPSQGSVMGPGLSQPQMMRSMSGSPFRPESGSMEVAPGSASQAHLQRAQFMSLTRSIDSFRVLAECPLIVMLLFQLYPKFQKYIPGIVPLMMQALSLSPVTVTSAFRAKYKELIAAQVRVLVVCIYFIL